jgi:hypothetical protein
VSARANLTLNVELATVGFGYQPAQIQPKSKATGISLSGTIGSVKWFANLRQVLCRNTLTLIYHFYAGLFFKIIYLN